MHLDCIGFVLIFLSSLRNVIGRKTWVMPDRYVFKQLNLLYYRLRKTVQYRCSTMMYYSYWLTCIDKRLLCYYFYFLP
jgi:hypothetical protein